MADMGLLIPLNGLAATENCFSWHVGKEFFDSFGNSEISDAGLDVSATVEKKGRKVFVECRAEGKVTVACDRCLEDLDMPVEAHADLEVRFGEGDDAEEDGREVVFVDADEQELDLSQIVYDYICLSLPMQRTHRSGECNPDTIRYMGAAGPAEVSPEEPETDNPFFALKGLFQG